MNIKDYAISLLESEGCTKDTYRDTEIQSVMEDLGVYYLDPNHNKPAEFSNEDIAKALIEIGNEQPIVKPDYKYTMIWDNGDCVDGEHYKTKEEAIIAAQNTYRGWMEETIAENPTPFEKWDYVDIVKWDRMIDDCICYIIPYTEHPETLVEDAEYYLSYEEMEECGWKYYDEIVKR